MTIPLTAPAFFDEDPRRGVHGLLGSMGMSVLLMAPTAIEHVLAEAIRRAPVLASSSTLGGGVMRLDADPETAWVAVESATGSAVIVFGSPQSNSDLLFQKIVLPFEAATAPYERGMVFQGTADERIAALLTEYDIVAVSEFPPFQHIAAAEGHPVLPISARRAARHWERVNADLYTVLLDVGPEAQVYLWRMNGRAELVTPVGEGSVPSWTAPLIAAGTHRVETMDPHVLLVTSAPSTSYGAELDAAARRLVAEASEAFENAKRDALGEPSQPTSPNFWERLDRSQPGVNPGRPWSPPAVLPESSVIERVREAVADDDSSFEHVDRLAHALRRHRNSGFEHAWRGGDDTLLSPSWLTVRSAVIDPATGHVVAGGHLTHGVWGLSPAHDIGAVDGRNGVTFAETGHPGGLMWPTTVLYVGSTRTGVLVPLDATLNVTSVDLDAARGLIAVLHHLGASTFAITLITSAGERRVLTVLEGLSGNEHIRFSNDRRWLLVPRSKDSLLVEVATGRWLAIGVANTGWWPHDASTLISVHHDGGRAFPVLFDLSSNAYGTSFPYIELDVPLLETFPYVWYPAVSPDAAEVLAVSPAGVSVEYQQKHGTGSHLVRFTLATGRGTLVAAPFLDTDQTLERDASDIRWTQRAVSAGALTLSPDLAASLREPVVTHEWLADARWADEAEQPLVMSLNAAVAATKDGRAFPDLLPEILAYLVPVSADPSVWGRQAEWLLDLRETTAGFIAAGTIDGELAACWQRYGAAISAIERGRPDLVDSVGSGISST